MPAIECEKKKRKNSHVEFETFETGRFERIFKVPEIIGKGGFGQVYKAIHKLENHVYAIKKIILPIGRDDSIHQH